VSKGKVSELSKKANELSLANLSNIDTTYNFKGAKKQIE
jgi:hypothetical protein